MNICETIYRKIVGSRMKIRNLSLLLEETKNIKTQKDLDEKKAKLDYFKSTDLQRFTKYITEIKTLKLNFKEEIEKLGRVKSFKHDEDGFLKEIYFLGFTNGEVDLKGFERLEKITIKTLQEISKLSLPKKLLYLELNKADFKNKTLDLSESESIEEIIIQACDLVHLKTPKKVKKILISFCHGLSSQLDYSSIEGLEELYLSIINNLKSINLPTTIKNLTISICSNLEETLDLRHLNELENLDLTGTNIVELFLPTSLKKIDLTDCKQLKTIKNLGELVNLEEIRFGKNIPTIEPKLPKGFKQTSPGIFTKKKN